MSFQPCRIHQQWSLLDTIYRLVDAMAIVLALILAAGVTGATANPDRVALAATGVVLFYLVGELTGLYRSWRGVSIDREVVCALLTWVVAGLSLVTVGYFTTLGASVTRRELLTWLASAPCLFALARVCSRLSQQFLLAKGFNTRGFAIVGANDLGFQLARNIAASPQMGLKLIGFYDDRPASRRMHVPPDLGTHLGNLDELILAARQGQVSMIYIAFPMRAERRIRDVLARLSDTTASVYVVPDFFVFELLHSRWTNIGGLPAVSVFENPFYGVDGVIKRAVDVALASAAILLAGIPMLLIAIAVKLDSPGPVFFRQKRYGLNGQTIKVWKFRTMRVCENGPVVQQATRHDPRVTRLGAILRRTSLDELPQLLNVLEGSMSLVGPRPHASAHNETFRGMIQGYMLRHKVKPGITGLAQVSGARGETDTVDKMKLRVEYDHRYIREWSLWLDIKILFKTLFTVLRHEGAY